MQISRVPGALRTYSTRDERPCGSIPLKSVSLDLEAEIETTILPHAIIPTHISNIVPVNSAADSQRSLSDAKPCGGVRLSVNFCKSVSIRSFRYLAQKVVAVEFEFLPPIFDGSLIQKSNM